MSYNSLFGLGTHSVDSALEGWWKLQDNAANTTVVDSSGKSRTGTLAGGDNTSTKSVSGSGFLASAFDLNGTDDNISMSGTGLNISGSLSFLARVSPDQINNQSRTILGAYDTGGAFAGYGVRFGDGGGRIEFWNSSSWAVSSDNVVAATTWKNIAVTNNGSNTRFYSNGTALGSPSHSSPSSWTGTKRIGSRSGGIDQFYDGKIADVSIFSRALAEAEIGEWDDGPEPLSTVAPTLSGTETEGQTLTSTTGTWDSQSNGTVTYSYQWTRSNDGSGAGEANISGATSSTYTLVTADVGKFIRCRVRGSNDGGFDAAEDINSNFTGAIAAAAPPPTDIIPLIQHHRQLMGA